ncbi:MAG: hypothetical protein BLM47_07630 [Candidatus Reconcilbacillus cellulovorans]|uniref:ATP synthase subunit I n=1 Tax=Candidatus Reconcilbacillus cellulovorans TaxID=1906605 RepID=A0A2A6E031_9BACL|nr:MAG: hypothetical protein BLM47_07630 [Candidatus Reconcilbacillus cellulovorans]
MDEFKRHIGRLSSVMCFFLCLSLVAAVEPAWRAYALGAALGMAAGWLNALHLAWRIRRLAYGCESARKTRLLGFTARASTALLAVVLAVRAGPERVSLVATIVGLVVVPILSFVLGAVGHAGKPTADLHSRAQADEAADGGKTGRVSERGEDRHA